MKANNDCVFSLLENTREVKRKRISSLKTTAITLLDPFANTDIDFFLDDICP